MAARGWIWAGTIGAAALAAAVWAFRPEPVAVDLAPVTRGSMAVTVAAEGKTRLAETWEVTAPIAGMLARSPVQLGDAVTGGDSIVALIEPAEPAFLDARARSQAEAAVAEAEAAVRLAEVQLDRAGTDLDYARNVARRNRELAARGAVSQQALEASAQAEISATAAQAAARQQLDLARATLTRMQAQLMGPAGPGAQSTGCCVELRAPVTGVVLSVESLSARVVQPGDRLLTLGDLAMLEIEVDMPSADALRIRPGAAATVERWGGPVPLAARVRQVEPLAFTEVSALGIEEQRVRVILDIDTPPEARQGLGTGYAVFARITVWEGRDVVQAPLAALFRQGAGWAVFVARGDRAVLTPVEVGQMTETAAEILAGLAPGEALILWPGDRVADGAPLRPRPAP